MKTLPTLGCLPINPHLSLLFLIVVLPTVSILGWNLEFVRRVMGNPKLLGSQTHLMHKVRLIRMVGNPTLAKLSIPVVSAEP